MCRRVQVPAPGRLAPSFRIAVAGIAAAGGSFAFEDEVDPAKFVRGVTAGATGLVVRSGHDAPPVSVVCERGCRVAAPAFLTMAMNCPATRPPSLDGAGASARLDDRRIFVVEMRVFVRVQVVEIGVRLWSERSHLSAPGAPSACSVVSSDASSVSP